MKYKNFKDVPTIEVDNAYRDLNIKLDDGTILFEEFTAFLKMPKTKRKQIFGFTEAESFIVKEFFDNGIHGKTPLRMSEYFILKVYLWSQKLVIEIPSELPKINEYILPKNMIDSTIQRNAQSKPMILEEYYLVIYMLIGKPNLADKDKTYLCHVFIDHVVYGLNLYYDQNGWSFGACKFTTHGINSWNRGSVFLSLP